jgi:hypothetical protein
MNMEHWNDAGGGKLKYRERNLFQCDYVHHKSHMNGPGNEPGTPQSEMTINFEDN